MDRWFGARVSWVVSSLALLAGCGGTSGVSIPGDPDGGGGPSATDAASSDGTLPEGAGRDDGKGCVPDDSADCAGKCGSLRGRCENIVACGACGQGEICGGAGPNKCGKSPCVSSCAGKACGTSDGCSGVCSPPACDACLGVTCSTPPAPTVCYQPAGTCSAGACSYAFANGATCDDGDVCTTNDACTGGKCAGTAMACTTPPPPYCASSSTLRTYVSPGACSSANGQCKYTYVDSICPAKCASGACLPCTPVCEGKSCGADDGCAGKCTTGCANGKTLLFGGLVNSVTLGDTWEWDGVAWQQVNLGGGGPPARDGHGAARLGASTIVFGGLDASSTLLGDTWEWNGSAWSQKSTGGPAARQELSMATRGNRIVLFGGADDSRSTRFSDTWEWDGATWTQKATTGPAARYGAAMATLGGKVVLFGGVGTDFLADTWEWDGTTWTNRNVKGPPARIRHAMATLNGKIVLFGGMNAQTDLYVDMWEWDGTAWTQKIGGSTPTARSAHALATLNGRVLFFGGYDQSFKERSDLWDWDGAKWSLHAVRTPPARALFTMTGP